MYCLSSMNPRKRRRPGRVTGKLPRSLALDQTWSIRRGGAVRHSYVFFATLLLLINIFFIIIKMLLIVSCVLNPSNIKNISQQGRLFL